MCVCDQSYLANTLFRFSNTNSHKNLSNLTQTNSEIPLFGSELMKIPFLWGNILFLRLVGTVEPFTVQSPRLRPFRTGKSQVRSSFEPFVWTRFSKRSVSFGRSPILAKLVKSAFYPEDKLETVLRNEREDLLNRRTHKQKVVPFLFHETEHT